MQQNNRVAKKTANRFKAILDSPIVNASEIQKFVAQNPSLLSLCDSKTTKDADNPLCWVLETLNPSLVESFLVNVEVKKLYYTNDKGDLCCHYHLYLWRVFDNARKAQKVKFNKLLTDYEHILRLLNSDHDWEQIAESCESL
ncbi:MAG: hypothetical protein R3B41_00150 [Candidatus Doudnabacteria bacterium]